MNHTVDMTKGSIPKHIKALAIPTSIGFFFNTMYNIVDTYYAGILNTQSLAALSLSFPIFFIFISLASGISTGATTLISNSLGERNSKKAKLYAVQSISFAVLISLVSMVVMYLLAPFLFGILGAEGEYLSIALEYMNPIIIGSVFFFLAFTFNAILASQGDTRPFRNFLVIGFFLNVIFDPLFMFGFWIIPAFGIKGIAFATILIEAIGVIYLFAKAARTDLLTKDCCKNLFPNIRIYKDIFHQGFPAALNMMTVALGAFIITYFISDFGKEAVAAYGAAIRIEQIFLLPSIGINMATLTIVGQNNGAKKMMRVKETIKKSLAYGYIIVGAGMVLMFGIAPYLMKIFSNDAEVVNIGAEYLRIAAFIGLGYVTLFLLTSALQGMKKPMFALYIGAYRQIIAPLVIFYLFTVVWAFGLYGIWFGIFVLVWSSVIIAYFYMRKVFRKKVKKIKKSLD